MLHPNCLSRQWPGVLRWLAVAVIWLMALATTGFGPSALIESEQASAPVASSSLRLLAADQPPEVQSKALVVMDADSGEIVYGVNAHDRRAMASTTKIMTALVTLENAKLDEVVTAGPDVLVEPSVMGLDPGDKLTVEQLLYGLLLPSGNDAAIALADYVGGSVEGFVAMMNEKAETMGLKDTHFVTPNGLDAKGHFSSAYDLAILARTALQDPVFARIVRTQEYSVEWPVPWHLHNTNQLLGTYQGADGVKTGYTDNAGRCLVFSATRQGHRAISVVLDSTDMWGESRSLLDYFFANYTWVPLRIPVLPLSDYEDHSERFAPGAGTRNELVAPKWERATLRWSLSASDGPYVDDGLLGVVTYYLLGDVAAEVDLYRRTN